MTISLRPAAQVFDAIAPALDQFFCEWADLINEAVVQHLKTAGCAEVWVGEESGSQTVLNAMDKGLRLPFGRVTRFLKEPGIRAC